MTDSARPPARIGHGFDIHRLEPPPPAGRGRPFILGGVRFEHSSGPVAHSDGDALYHAITDAILGALAERDLGQQFPDSEPDLDGADSSRFLAAAAQKMREAGYEVGNLDATVICEKPRISPRKEAMRRNLADLLGCDLGRVNVKGRSHEKVGEIGAGRAVVVHAVVLLAAAP